MISAGTGVLGRTLAIFLLLSVPATAAVMSQTDDLCARSTAIETEAGKQVMVYSSAFSEPATYNKVFGVNRTTTLWNSATRARCYAATLRIASQVPGFYPAASDVRRMQDIYAMLGARRQEDIADILNALKQAGVAGGSSRLKAGVKAELAGLLADRTWRCYGGVPLRMGNVQSLCDALGDLLPNAPVQDGALGLALQDAMLADLAVARLEQIHDLLQKRAASGEPVDVAMLAGLVEAYKGLLRNECYWGAFLTVLSEPGSESRGRPAADILAAFHADAQKAMYDHVVRYAPGELVSAWKAASDVAGEWTRPIDGTLDSMLNPDKENPALVSVGCMTLADLMDKEVASGRSGVSPLLDISSRQLRLAYADIILKLASGAVPGFAEGVLQEKDYSEPRRTFPGLRDSLTRELAENWQETAVLPMKGRSFGTSVVIVFDSSASMQEPIADGGRKIDVARKVASQVLGQAVPGKGVEWALYAFDGARPMLKVPFKDGTAEVADAIGQIEPRDSTPLADALKEAADFAVRKGRYDNVRLLVLSDGCDSVGGDPVKAAQMLDRQYNRRPCLPVAVEVPTDTKGAPGITRALRSLSVTVIGLSIKQVTDQDKLRAIAEAGRGEYLSADKVGQLSTALRDTVIGLRAEALLSEAERSASHIPVESDPVAVETLKKAGESLAEASRLAREIGDGNLLDRASRDGLAIETVYVNSLIDRADRCASAYPRQQGAEAQATLEKGRAYLAEALQEAGRMNSADLTARAEKSRLDLESRRLEVLLASADRAAADFPKLRGAEADRSLTAAYQSLDEVVQAARAHKLDRFLAEVDKRKLALDTARVEALVSDVDACRTEFEAKTGAPAEEALARGRSSAVKALKTVTEEGPRSMLPRVQKSRIDLESSYLASLVRSSDDALARTQQLSGADAAKGLAEAYQWLRRAEERLQKEPMAPWDEAVRKRSRVLDDCAVALMEKGDTATRQTLQPCVAHLKGARLDRVQAQEAYKAGRYAEARSLFDRSNEGAPDLLILPDILAWSESEARCGAFSPAARLLMRRYSAEPSVLDYAASADLLRHANAAGLMLESRLVSAVTEGMEGPDVQSLLQAVLLRSRPTVSAVVVFSKKRILTEQGLDKLNRAQRDAISRWAEAHADAAGVTADYAGVDKDRIIVIGARAGDCYVAVIPASTVVSMDQEEALAALRQSDPNAAAQPTLWRRLLAPLLAERFRDIALAARLTWGAADAGTRDRMQDALKSDLPQMDGIEYAVLQTFEKTGRLAGTVEILPSATLQVPDDPSVAKVVLGQSKPRAIAGAEFLEHIVFLQADSDAKRTFLRMGTGLHAVKRSDAP